VEPQVNILGIYNHGTILPRSRRPADLSIGLQW
jgi:hypothetical protein